MRPVACTRAWSSIPAGVRSASGRLRSSIPAGLNTLSRVLPPTGAMKALVM
jgi:hypothetical protein